MAAADIALCVMHGERDALAAKQPDEILRVQPCDKLGRVAAPFGQLRSLLRREGSNARGPVERRLSVHRWGWRARCGRGVHEAGELLELRDGVAKREIARFREEVDGVALAATGVAFPVFESIVAGEQGERRGCVLVKRTARRFLRAVAVTELSHERGERETALGFGERVIIHRGWK